MTEKDDNVTEQTSGQTWQTTVQTTGRTRRRKVREGLVVSDKMDKTVVVSVEDRVKHALYGKVMRRTSKLKAHDEQNQCGVGDRVLLMETRPLSATKRWRVVEVLEKAK
jgi:small subunit ribosomal protein S17